MKKLLVIAPNSVHTLNFLEFVKNLFDEIILCSEQEVESKVPDRQYQVNFKTINPLTLLSQRKALKKIIVNEAPDLVHVHQVTRHAFAAVPLVKSLKRPVILSAWGSDVLVVPDQSFLYKWLVSRTLKKADVVVCDSQEMMLKIESLGRGENNEMVLFGIEPIEEHTKSKIVYSNRLHEKLYNIDVIIRLFANFSKDNPDWKLRIAGSGGQTAQLTTLVETLGVKNSVQFIGWLSKEENRKEYQNAAVYISIPDSDGTAVSLLEAMSAGCIPVVPDLPVSKEWITDGENGIVHNGNQNPLARSVELNSELVKGINKKIIEEKGTQDVTRVHYQRIYKSLI